MFKYIFSVLIACFFLNHSLFATDEDIHPELAPITMSAELQQIERDQQLLDKWETSQYLCADSKNVDGVTSATAIGVKKVPC